jgi:hypothetical protein
MTRRPSSHALKLALVGFLCASLACATSRVPASSGDPDPADPPAAQPVSTDSVDQTKPPPPAPDARSSADASADAATDPATDPDAAKPDDGAAKKSKPQTVAQHRRQNQIARRAEAALESMIIGTVIGAQFGPIGAAVGAGTFMLWGAITGDVPFEGGRRNAPPPGRGGGTARGSDEEMENEVDDELKKKQDLEAEIEIRRAELRFRSRLVDLGRPPANRQRLTRRRRLGDERLVVGNRGPEQRQFLRGRDPRDGGLTGRGTRRHVGAAWSKRSSEGRDYLSVKLDDPSFNAPIYANLFNDEDGETFTLIWSRGRKATAD